MISSTENLPQMCNVFQTNWWTHQLVDVYLWIPDKVADKYVEFVGKFGHHLQKHVILAQSFWSRVRFELVYKGWSSEGFNSLWSSMKIIYKPPGKIILSCSQPKIISITEKYSSRIWSISLHERIFNDVNTSNLI